MNTGICQRGHNLDERPYISPKDGKRQCGECRRLRDSNKRQPLPKVPFADRFWAKVDTSAGPDACWPWLGAVNPNGYGRNRAADGSFTNATATAWELTNGSTPEGLWFLHHCDNPPCVNPSHLFLGTVLDNNRDMIAKGRAHWQSNSQRQL